MNRVLIAVFLATASVVEGVSLEDLVYADIPKIGKLQGLKDDSGAGVFNGIPFSLPPVGKYRWRKPQPITERINTGEEYYNATYPRAACSEQHSFTNIIQPIKFDEDCLHAQINVPSKLLEKRKTEQGYHYVLKSDAANAKLPVMVYFYGGAYTTGANYIYQPQYITKYGDVIVVVPNYRLGVFGFFYQDSGDADAALGNYGIWDQIESLRWVRRVIDGFGGDPDQVTIFGESAGAQSVGIHLVNKYSDPLFKNAIMESNPMAVHYPTPKEAQRISDHYVNWMKNSNQKNKCGVNDMKCLRDIPMEDLLKYQQSLPWQCMLPEKIKLKLFKMPIDQIPKFTPLIEPWAPVVDDKLLMEQPLATFKKGHFQRKPVIFGYTKNEAMLFIDVIKNKFTKKVSYAGAMKELDAKPKVAYSVENVVPIHLLKHESTEGFSEEYGIWNIILKAIIDLITDLGDTELTNELFVCPGRNAFNSAKSTYKNASLPVWWYSFQDTLSHPALYQSYKDCAKKSCHGAEIPFLFKFNNLTYTNDEIDLSQQMIYYWTNFAKSGNPNLSEQGSMPVLRGRNKFPPEVARWPRMYKDSNTDDIYKTMVLRTEVKGGLEVINNFDMKPCDKIQKRKSEPGTEMNLDFLVNSKCLP